MKLHSDILDRATVLQAMNTARRLGRVTRDIELITLEPQGSRSRKHGFKIQLGTYDQSSGPTKSRHLAGGQHGAIHDMQVWAATYDEWGWFIAELFAIDPDALFGPYKGLQSFNEQTGFKYVRELVIQEMP